MSTSSWKESYRPKLCRLSFTYTQAATQNCPILQSYGPEKDLTQKFGNFSWLCAPAYQLFASFILKMVKSVQGKWQRVALGGRQNPWGDFPEFFV